MISSKQWTLDEEDAFAPNLLEYLRNSGLIGSLASEYGGPDELMLISDGPITNDSNLTLIAGPPTIRCTSTQPSRARQPPSKNPSSALDGMFDLTGAETTCDWQVEEWGPRGWESRVTIERESLASSLRALSPLLPDIATPEIITPGGFAGLLTYDLVQWTEPVRLQNLPEPSTLLGILFRVDRWIVHNREEGILSILSLHPDGWFNNCSEVIDEWILNRLTTTITPAEQSPSHSTISDDEHCNIVDTVRSAIKDGDFYQLNYGRIWSGKISEPWTVFKRLLKSNPAPYSGWLSIPDHDYVVASVSPELLLSIQGDELSTRPIKGTRPRARRRDRDEALKRELVSSRKEVSEHMMLVDLERNDLGKVCRVGSVKWHDWRIESHPNVHHLVSDVRGRLREDCDSWDAVQALFPGGSITGCPKTATIAAIDELEATPRHAWTGSLGFHDPRSGVACWNILIRTLEAKRVELGDWQAKVQAGGGLVYDSISTQEVEEAKWKAQALLDAAWGVSESNIPKGKMSIECVPALDERTESLLQSLNSKSQICISPAEPIRWIHGDAPLPSTKMGERRLLFVDNLDSFSWNIIHVAAQLGAEVVIVEGRGELAMSGAKHIVESIKPTHIIIGPGPGRPSHSPLTQLLAKNSIEGKIINEAGDIIPLLGICLGHQALGEAVGWELMPAPSGAVHGVPDDIIMGENELFSRIPSVTKMMRYHSLILNPTNQDLEIIATDNKSKSLVMGLMHPELPIWGVQFHPESCGSPDGWKLLDNFLTKSNRIVGQSVEVPLLGREG